MLTTEKNLAFHLGEHVHDSVSWPNMSPDGGDGDKPGGALAAAIGEWFGSFDGFRAHFELAQRMDIVQLYEHQGNVPVCMVALLLDGWEHAHYLDYQNNKAAFVKVWSRHHAADAGRAPRGAAGRRRRRPARRRGRGSDRHLARRSCPLAAVRQQTAQSVDRGVQELNATLAPAVFT